MVAGDDKRVYDALVTKLPLMLRSFGLAAIITLIKGGGRGGQEEFVRLGLTIFAILGLLTAYAPQVARNLQGGLGTTIGLGMIGGAGDKMCDEKDCHNPFSNDILVGQVNKIISKTTEPTEPTEPTATATATETSTKKGDKPLPLGKALALAGFNPAWTLEKVTKLAQMDPDRLADIDKNAKALSHKRTITHRDIADHYPSYLPVGDRADNGDYICRKIK